MVVVVLPDRWASLHEPLDPWCWCHPTVEACEGGEVVVHNAPGLEHRTRWLTIPYPRARPVVAHA